MNMFFVLTFFTALFKSSLSVEYDVRKNKYGSQVSSPAFDNDLDTYEQAHSPPYQASIKFEFKEQVNVKKILVWLPTNYIEELNKIFIYVSRIFEYKYNDPKYLFCIISNYTKHQINNCSSNDSSVFYGKYVTLTTEYGSARLQVSEIVIITEERDLIVARLGSRYQSYAYNHESNALDDDINTCMNTATDVISDRNKAGWWSVDMMQEYNITAVELNEYNTDPLYSGFYSIYISTDDLIKNYSLVYQNNDLCFQFKEATTNGTQSYNYLKLYCNRVMNGRYLAVVRNSDYRPDALNFCEIKIHALHDFDLFVLPSFEVTTNTFITKIILTTMIPYTTTYFNNLSTLESLNVQLNSTSTALNNKNTKCAYNKDKTKVVIYKKLS